MAKGIEVNISKLEDFIKAMKGNPKARVGIMGDSDHRDDGLSNATIGAIHEFGHGVPQRSFLRVPLIDGLNEAVKDSITPDDLTAIVDNKSLVPLIRKIGIVAEEVVGKAFDTGGNGKWPKWTTPGYKNLTGKLLVDTQQLRNSITSVVVDDE